MLLLPGKRQSGNYCDGVSRRDFMKIGALGLTGLGLPDLLRPAARAAGAASRPDTSVVLLWLDGGPTHIETFDPKMDAPEEFRSLVGAVQTKVPGLAFGGLFPKLAQVADKMAIVRSFATGADTSHPGGSHAIKTGYPLPPGVMPSFTTQTRPSVGSIVARARGANHPRTGVPTFIETQVAVARKFGVHHSEPLWLGKEYGPFRADEKGAVEVMSRTLPAQALQDRRALLQALDQLDRGMDRNGSIKGFDGFQQQAFQALTANRVKEAFDLAREDAKTRAKYGKGLGERLMLARRLCEAGAGFVTVYFGDWDNHSNFGSMTDALQRNCPPVDHAVSAFIEDIHQRGLNENILLLITGEMGRSPRIGGLGTRSFGREHWPSLCALALAGGLKMGQVIGESTAKAEMPKSRPIGPQDLMATVLQFLGIDPEIQFKDMGGRPVSMVEEGKPIRELR